MDSFICQPELITTTSVTIQGEEHLHLSRVMRKRAGEEVQVTDGRGKMFVCLVESVERDRTVCRIVSAFEEYNEAAFPIILIQSILKNPNKMDWIVEKAVELGVHEIATVTTEHSVTQTAKIDRLNKLAHAATKQSLRSRIPAVLEVQQFAAALARFQRRIVLFFDESADPGVTLEAVLAELDLGRGVVLCIGPEGGFSPAERDLALSGGAFAVSLGPRRLRSETAAVAALARVSAFQPAV